MSGRSTASIALEADYAKLILADLTELNDLIAAAAEPLRAASVDLLAVMLSPATSPGDAELLARVFGSVGDCLRVIATMHDPVVRLLDLLGGRLDRLHAELDDDDGEGGEPS